MRGNPAVYAWEIWEIELRNYYTFDGGGVSKERAKWSGGVD
jgi:hypothetical protein